MLIFTNSLRIMVFRGKSPLLNERGVPDFPPIFHEKTMELWEEGYTPKVEQMESENDGVFQGFFDSPLPGAGYFQVNHVTLEGRIYHQTFFWYPKWRNPHYYISCMDVRLM